MRGSAPANEAHRDDGLVARVFMDDWNELLGAVTGRLRTSVSDAAADHPLGRVRADVLECVLALDHLQHTLRHELARRHALELELVDAQTALARARAELQGTQAGERQARHLAAHDALTTLPNRQRFRERLDLALGPQWLQSRGLAVLYLDLDGFKPINDRHGHAMGDEVLRIVATRLTRALRAEDMVSRQGGDEFACLVTNGLDREQLARLACKLIDIVAAPLTVGELQLTVAASIGIAMCSTHGCTSAALLENADAAMFRAKRLRSGHAFFDDEADVQIATEAKFRCGPGA
jgi:diguanylate cyclase